MTIVRELVTRLGFQVDNRGIENFNKSIIGFKTRFALAAGTVATVLNKALGFFNDVAESVNSSQDLAAATGVSLTNIIAMEKAASQFRVTSSEFQGIFAGFNSVVQSAKVGMGALPEIARQTGLEFKNANGDIKNTEELFVEVLKYIGQIPTEVEKVRIAGNIFPGFGNQVARLAQDVEKFSNSTEGFTKFGKEIQDQIKTINDYQEAVNGLSMAWSELSTNLAIAVFPTITQSLQGFNEIINRGKEFGGGVSGFLEGFSEALLTTLGFDTLPNVQIQAYKDEIEFQKRLGAYLKEQQEQKNAANNSTVNFTNNFEFDVPPGMPEQQAQMIKEYVQEGVRDEIDATFSGILNNNPQGE